MAAAAAAAAAGNKRKADDDSTPKATRPKKQRIAAATTPVRTTRARHRQLKQDGEDVELNPGLPMDTRRRRRRRSQPVVADTSAHRTEAAVHCDDSNSNEPVRPQPPRAPTPAPAAPVEPHGDVSEPVDVVQPVVHGPPVPIAAREPKPVDPQPQHDATPQPELPVEVPFYGGTAPEPVMLLGDGEGGVAPFPYMGGLGEAPPAQPALLTPAGYAHDAQDDGEGSVVPCPATLSPAAVEASGPLTIRCPSMTSSRSTITSLEACSSLEEQEEEQESDLPWGFRRPTFVGSSDPPSDLCDAITTDVVMQEMFKENNSHEDIHHDDDDDDDDDDEPAPEVPCVFWQLSQGPRRASRFAPAEISPRTVAPEFRASSQTIPPDSFPQFSCASNGSNGPSAEGVQMGGEWAATPWTRRNASFLVSDANGQLRVVTVDNHEGASMSFRSPWPYGDLIPGPAIQEDMYSPEVYDEDCVAF